ncbi:MAG TPA: prolyl oligopeptidase family serine peptidase [Caulobacteraceae bacterium]|nr:prolyl oligopeptidase family serine peptidase [Caulobacteraceae bacterium]
MANAVKPEALEVEGAPPIPAELVRDVGPYLEARFALVAGWRASDKSLLVTTRFGATPQLHSVAFPMGARRQLTFEADRIADAHASPSDDTLVVSMDVGGSEFFQLYTLANGRLSLITDGKSRNLFGAFSRDGRLIGYSSSRRNGVDSDLYVVDPRDPASERRVLEATGGGWAVLDFMPDGRRLLVMHYMAASRSVLYLLDTEDGALAPITDEDATIAWRSARAAPDGTIWAISDVDSDALRLGRLDPATRTFHAASPAGVGEVESFGLSVDGGFVSYAVNAAGFSRLRILDVAAQTDREVTDLPPGVIMAGRVAPWGDIALTVSGPKTPADAFVVDPRTLAVTRWTESECGGLDPSRNADAELVSIASFDGETVTGFLFRPDPDRFTGPRPLVINIHGGPEAQARPNFLLGATGYLINELGVAVFFPNVRGSAGFGKRFLALDDGPFLRENSVKDIGAFIDHFAADAGVDAARMAVTGGSYGGYMTLAARVRWSDKLRCGCEQVGISNLVTFLENTQAYRRDLRRVEYGDERDPVQRAKLIEISPLTHVSNITVPLMVVTGANDPRVPASEADQIVAAVRANGREVWHLRAANEGHGFVRKDNLDYTVLVMIQFWKRFLIGNA